MAQEEVNKSGGTGKRTCFVLVNMNALRKGNDQSSSKANCSKKPRMNEAKSKKNLLNVKIHIFILKLFVLNICSKKSKS